MVAYPLPRQEAVFAAAVPDWRHEAVASYRRAERDRSLAPGVELATRVRALTGLRIPPDSTYVDREAGCTTVAASGSVFRLTGGTLVLLRPCAHCGTGQFASPPIERLADLGYALADWTPLHDDCRQADPADML